MSDTINLKNTDKIIDKCLEYIKDNIESDDLVRSMLFDLFNSGYKSGYVTCLSISIEQDQETLRYLNNYLDNKNNTKH